MAAADGRRRDGTRQLPRLRIRIQRPAAAFARRLHQPAAAAAAPAARKRAQHAAGGVLQQSRRDTGARTEERAPQLAALLQAQRQLQLRFVGHLQPELSGQQQPDLDHDHHGPRAELVERPGRRSRCRSTRYSTAATRSNSRKGASNRSSWTRSAGSKSSASRSSSNTRWPSSSFRSCGAPSKPWSRRRRSTA